MTELRHTLGGLRHTLGGLRHTLGGLRNTLGGLRHTLGELRHLGRIDFKAYLMLACNEGMVVCIHLSSVVDPYHVNHVLNGYPNDLKYVLWACTQQEGSGTSYVDPSSS